MPDVVVVGAGLSGSLAAIMLSQRGFQVTIIDRYAVYPAEFRAEQIVGNQIEFFTNIGLTTKLVSSSRLVPLARNFSLRRQLASVFASHYGLPYQDIVQAVRDQIPQDVQTVVGRVTDVESGPRTLVHLEDGRTIDAGLVIMATGLNTKLGRRLGADYETISPQHSTTVGFDVQSPRCSAAEASVLVFYGNSPRDGIDYLTIFPCKDVLRGNLFLYRDPQDPWVRQLCRTPRETLLKALPALASELGEFTIQHLQCRTSDVAVLRNHQRDGVVYIGDAYQTPCPAAGTGISRLLVDVERLGVHVARWFAANDVSAASLQSYYDDPVKNRSDRAAIRVARFRRAVSTNGSLAWALRRQGISARRFIKYALYSLGGLLAQAGQVMPLRFLIDRVVAGRIWPSWSRAAGVVGVNVVGAVQGPVTPDGAS